MTVTLQQVKTGVLHPRKALRYIRQRTRERGRRTAMYGQDALTNRLLQDHGALLDAMREQDEYLLIVLDACRYDYFREVSHLYLDGDLQPAYTPARDTFEYVRQNWSDHHDVTYVSGAVPINSKQIQINQDSDLNRYYDGYRPADHIEKIVDVWETGWDDDLGTVPPEAVTAAALDHDTADRVVAHYFQPHAPYIGDYQLLGHTGAAHRPNQGMPNDELVWRRVQRGEISAQELQTAYRSNLLRVLDLVRELVDNTRHQNVYITGDHGEALGEYGVYAHPRDYPHHPKVHAVPWFEVDV